jgi:hypothetical protein
LLGLRYATILEGFMGEGAGEKNNIVTMTIDALYITSNGLVKRLFSK